MSNLIVFKLNHEEISGFLFFLSKPSLSFGPKVQKQQSVKKIHEGMNKALSKALMT